LTIPPGHRCCIIAEAGVNHNGSRELAFELVEAAVAAGADIVKFQTFKAEKLVTKDAPKAAYQARTTQDDSGQFEMLRKLELGDEVFADLMAHCAKRGIGFLSTPFDSDSAAFLAKLGVPAFKVSSGDLTNLPFLRDLASHRLPIILSSGMASLAELDEAVSALLAEGVTARDLTLLHCTTEYPAPVSEVNLKAMLTIRAAYPGTVVGYSDHTEGIHIPVAAAALGAEVLEKHFTLDRTLPGPDHKASLEPAELKAMVDQVRAVEAALGDGWKRPTASELPNRLAARKSIVAARAIRAGEVLSAENLTTRRPGDGISPMRWDEFIGRPAARDLVADEKL
jgi:N,N'-diacetyllegionaminate synthase